MPAATLSMSWSAPLQVFALYVRQALIGLYDQKHCVLALDVI
jgi:hypothetical protein